MLTETLRTLTPDGAAEALLFRPDHGSAAPLVVFLMDAFGLRPALTDMAARLVSAGYAVLQPNLYWRSGAFAPFDARTTFSDPPERARIFVAPWCGLDASGRTSPPPWIDAIAAARAPRCAAR